MWIVKQKIGNKEQKNYKNFRKDEIAEIIFPKWIWIHLLATI